MGGAETVTFSVARGLRERGHEVGVIVLKADGELGMRCREAGIPFESLGVARGASPANLASLIRVFRASRPHAVVGVNFNATLWARMAGVIARVPVRVTAEHSSAFLGPREARYSAVANRLLAPFTTSVLAVSRAQAEWLVAQGNPVARIRVVPNGIDLARFAGVPALSVAPHAPTVGIVASLVPAKNHANFLEAAARVAESIPDARFLVVGDGELRRSLELRASRLGLEAKVTFLGRRADVDSLLAEMDVVCLSSDTEAMPLCLLEAAAAGRPAVATRVGSVAEVVRNGVTGLLVKAGDADALASALVELLRDRQRLVAMGEAAREHARRSFGIDATVGLYEEIALQGCADGGGEPG